MKKKIIVVFSVLFLLAFVGLACFFVLRRFETREKFSKLPCSSGMIEAMGYGQRGCIFPQDQNFNQFYPPQDALAFGKITLAVDDIQAAKSNIENLAQKNEGVIYATKFSYPQNGADRGYLVIKISADKFEPVFGQIKSAGMKVIGESTEQMQVNSPIVYSAQDGISQPVEPESLPADDATTKTEQISNDSSAVIAPPIYRRLNQDKAYVQVLFNTFSDRSDSKRGWHFGGFGMMGAMRNLVSEGPSVDNSFAVSLAIKSVLLIVLLIFLVVVLRRIFKTYRNHKISTREARMQKNRKVPVVQLSAKTSRVASKSRLVRISKK
jgi:hypothetical protein